MNKQSNLYYIDYLETPLGLFEFQASDKGITQAIFCGDDLKKVQANHITNACKQQLSEYFAGTRKNFALPLDAKGTDFQKSVWDCLIKIPFGATVSYGEIATMLNKPKASQAVGGANGRSPISIIVPCHRVLGSNGSLTGYAGGIERKLWLLGREGIKVKALTEHNNLDIQNVIGSRQSKTQYLN